ncbi:MAG: hypothetical protein VB913_06315 [Rhodospirillales bacterium]
MSDITDITAIQDYARLSALDTHSEEGPYGQPAFYARRLENLKGKLKKSRPPERPGKFKIHLL